MAAIIAAGFTSRSLHPAPIRHGRPWPMRQDGYSGRSEHSAERRCTLFPGVRSSQGSDNCSKMHAVTGGKGIVRLPGDTNTSWIRTVTCN